MCVSTHYHTHTPAHTAGDRALLLLIPVAALGFVANAVSAAPAVLWAYALLVGLGEVVVCLQLKLLALPYVQRDFFRVTGERECGGW